MSRQFNPSGGSTTDVVVFSKGNAPDDQGPITIGVLAKMDVSTGDFWMLQGTKTGTPVYGFLAVNNGGEKLYIENDFDPTGVMTLVGGSWYWYVITKAAGSSKPRYHKWDLSGAWTHTDSGTNVGDGTGPIDTLRVGNNVNLNRNWRGLMAVDTAVDTAMNDAAVEAAFTLNASDLLTALTGAGGQSFMHRWNQGSTATSVTDDTGGGCDQSSITGTAVSADDPSGFDYSLTPPSVDGDAAQTVTFTGTATAAVDRPATASQTVTFAGAAVADVQRGQTASQTVAFAGTADAMVIHNASATQTITLGGTVTPEPDAAPAIVTGNWNSLLSIVRANIADVQRFRTQRIIECPNHAYPLEPGRTPDTVHCVFGGEVFDLYGNPR